LKRDNLIPTVNYTSGDNEISNKWTTVKGIQTLLRENVTFENNLIKEFNDFIKIRHNISYFCGVSSSMASKRKLN
jgi:hypothetical protein